MIKDTLYFVLAIALVVFATGCTSIDPSSICAQENVPAIDLMSPDTLCPDLTRKDTKYDVLSYEALGQIINACAHVVNMPYLENVRDCDDFSLYLKAEMYRTLSAFGINPLIADVGYAPDKGGAHSIVAVFTDQGWVFIEPRYPIAKDMYIPIIVELSLKEISTIPLYGGFDL